MKKTIAPALALLILLAASPAAPGQDPQRRLTDDPRVAAALEVMKVWLEAQQAYDRIPGLSAAVVHDQEVLWAGGFGFADLERRTPAAPGTIYSICSISKLFTSIAVLQLRDAGRLRLDDPVDRHLPWFTIKRTAPQGPEITIEGLLTHSSGLPRESDHPYWTGPDFAFPTREEIIERLSGQETLYPAATHFQYSNLGLSLAGEVVAAASGMPYAEYIKKNILEPLGLSSTTPDMPETERGGRLATGYGAVKRNGAREPMPFFKTNGVSPAAGFASTADDLARFASWQLRLITRGGEEVLRANTLREMHRIHWIEPDFETSTGLGFSVWRSDGKLFVGHGGSCPGFRTHLLLRPEERLAAAFLANAQGVNSGQYAQRLYDFVAAAVKDAVKNPSAAKPPDPVLKKYAGAYETSFGGEMAVVVWEGDLAMLPLPTMDPLRSLVKLRRIAEHTFRRVRKDEELGEEVVFEMAPDGRPFRIKWHQNHYPRRK
ncbi:MAG: beta-lactamase family protein [Candidatus Aminicenantes bacterium]|nr:beta-lactamase family protein [Candidatus Aminicenantes bacterium]